VYVSIRLRLFVFTPTLILRLRPLHVGLFCLRICSFTCMFLTRSFTVTCVCGYVRVRLRSCTFAYVYVRSRVGFCYVYVR
jgi:hypothetical protein